VSALPAADRPSRLPSLTTQIFIGLLLGVVIGYAWPSFGVALKPLADIFLRMIKMIIAPLLFSTLVVGIAGTGDLKEMGRIGAKALIWFQAGTLVALAISLVMMNVFQPGAGVAIQLGAGPEDMAAMAGRQRGAWDIIINVFPTSVIDAMARGDILQIVVFATIFGTALSAIGEKGAPVVAVLDAVAHVMFRFTAYVMLFAPVGVMAAIAATVGGHGVAILVTLGKLVVVMYGALVIYVLVAVIGAAVLVRVPILAFMRAIREPFLIAFTTSSSEAALPKALEVMERFGVPKRIVGFVLPTGYSLNLDGSTLYLAAASLFVAQIAGIELGLGQQLLIMLTLLLTSKGVAGVPRAALVILTGTLHTFGLPLEGAALLLGVDQLLDMGRTAVNVMGNCIATVVVARWEGVFDDARMRQAMQGGAAAPSAEQA
jgi:proton glutamate symport protein